MVTRKVSPVDTATPESCNGHGLTLNLVTVLLIISIAINAVSLYFLMGFNFSLFSDADIFGIKKAILEVEYDKVGGQKNYEVVSRYSQMQLKDQIPQLEKYINGGATPSPTTQNQPTPTQPNAGGTLSQADIATIKKDAVIDGSAGATILAVEYSDMECPFCIKQFHDTKLEPSLKAQYGDKIAFVFKQNKGVNHKGTEAKAIASLCAQKIGGDGAYIKFYKSVMEKSTNEGGVFDVAKLPEVAKASGIDVAKWQQCVDKKDTASLFASQTAEAQKFNLAGTPGTLLINLTTGKYDTVEGAYPYDTFSAKIDALMK